MAVCPLNNLVLTDQIPDTIQLKPATITTSPIRDDQSINDGTVVWTWNSVTGSRGNDLTIEYEVYVPYLDGQGTPVLNVTTGSPRQISTSCLADYLYHSIPLQSTDDDLFTAKSVCIQKSNSTVDSVPIPGSIVNYQHQIQVSDYFTLDTVTVNDLLSDGQLFRDNCQVEFKSGQVGGTNTTYQRNLVTGTSELAVANVLNGSGKRTGVQIDIDLSAVLTNLVATNRAYGGATRDGYSIDETVYDVGGTVFTINYDAEIDTHYQSEIAGTEEIDINDLITNEVDITAVNYDFINAISHGEIVTDDSSSRVVIGSITLTKSIYALNGIVGSYDSNSHVVAKDLVTYRLTAHLSHQNVQDLTIIDYLPPPIIDVDDLTTLSGMLQTMPGTPANPPAKNNIQYGPSDTYHQSKLPSLSKNSTSNSLKIDYGTYQTRTGLSSQVIDLLYTVEVSNEPTADGLILVNQGVLYVNGTKNRPLQRIVNQGIILDQPYVTITKAIVGSDNSDSSQGAIPITFNPIGSSGFSGEITINTAEIDADSNNNQAQDKIKYALVIKNTGSHTSYQTTVSDQLPVGLMNPSNLEITDGNKQPITLPNGSSITDLFNGGVNLGQLVHYTTSVTSPVIVITYEATIADTIETGSSLTNTADVSYYTNEESGIKFYDEFLNSDTSTCHLKRVTLAKTITNTSESHTNRSNTSNSTKEDCTIGEYVYYRTVIEFPRGVTTGFYLQDETNTKTSGSSNAGMNLDTSSVTINFTGGITITNPHPTPFSVSSGRYHQFDFGTITNPATPGSDPETITIEFRELVTDYHSLVNGSNVASKAKGYYQIAGSTTNGNSNTVRAYLQEPTISINKTLTSPLTSPVEGDTVTYTLTADSTGSAIDAKKFHMGDLLPEQYTVISATINGSSQGIALNGRSVSYDLDTYPTGTTTNLVITCILDSYRAGDNIINGCGVNYQSIANDSLARSYSDVGWHSVRTLPVLELSLVNSTYDHGTIDGHVTATIGDVMTSSQIVKFPTGTTYLKHIVVTSDEGQDLPVGSITLNKTGSLSYDPLTFAPVIIGSVATFPIDRLITNSGNTDQQIWFDYQHTSKNTLNNVAGHQANVNFAITIVNTAGNETLVTSEDAGFYIVEPQLTISQRVVELPLHPADTVKYQVTISAVNDTYTTDAFHLKVENAVNTNHFSAAIISDQPTGFTDESVFPNLLSTIDQITKGSSQVFEITGTMNQPAWHTLIPSTKSVQWTSQADTNALVKRDFNGVGGENNYFDSSTQHVKVEPMIDQIPAGDNYFSVLFEDSLDFDFDYEDVVLNCRYHIFRSKLGIVKMVLDFHLVSRGAAFKHAFGIYLPGINQATGNWQVKILTGGSVVEDPETIIRNYQTLATTQLTDLNQDRLPIFVDTHYYLPPDPIQDTFSANTHDRTETNPAWIPESSARCIIDFSTPWINTDLSILPYIDVWGYNSIATTNLREYQITLGDKVDFSRSGHDNFPRAIATKADFITGPDNYYGLKDVYTDFTLWTVTNPDYANIRSWLLNPPSWYNTTSELYGGLRHQQSEYTDLVNKPTDKPTVHQYSHKNLLRLGCEMQLSGTVTEIGTTHQSIHGASNILKVVVTSDQVYALTTSGTVLGTDAKGDTMTNLIDLVGGTTQIAGLKDDLTVVCSDVSQTDLLSWTDIYQLAYCGDIVVGLDLDHSIWKSGTNNINVSGWTNLRSIVGSSNYLMGLDGAGAVQLADMSGNQQPIWSGSVITAMSTSNSHCLGLTENRTVKTHNLSSGSGTIDNATNIVKISAGNGWSILLDQEGQLTIDGSAPSGVTNITDSHVIDVIATSDSLSYIKL